MRKKRKRHECFPIFVGRWENLSLAVLCSMRARIPSVGQNRLILPVRDQAIPNYSLLKSVGPEEIFSRERSRGTGPRATVKRRRPRV